MKILSLMLAVLAANVCIAGSLDTNYYNMHLDSDGDGWNNWNEYLAGTDPTDPANKPSVPVRVVLDYNGYLGPSAQSLIDGGRSIHMTFYDSPSMDGWPIYTLVTNSVDFTLNIPFEGDLYVWATAQMEGRDYTPLWRKDYSVPLYPEQVFAELPDPASQITYARAWNSNIMRATLYDDLQMRSYPRYRWEIAEDGRGFSGNPMTQRYRILHKEGRTEVFSEYIATPRTYFHEGDWIDKGTHGIGDINDTYVSLIYGNYNHYGSDQESYIDGFIFMAFTGIPLEAPSISTGYDTELVYARNELDWTMDEYASWYQISISSTATGTPALVTMPRTLIPFRNTEGQFAAPLPLIAGDLRSDGGSWTNARYWARVTTGREVGAPVSSSWHPFRLAVSTNTSKSVTGQLSYAGTNYFSATTSTNLLPVVVQFYTSPLYVGLPDAQIQIAASAWTTNAMAPTANYEIRGLRKGQDYYGRAFVDVNTNKTMETYESRAVGYDFTKAKPIPIRVPSHELVTTNYNMTIIDTDIDNDGLPDIWEWYKSGTITKGPLELGSM